MNESDWKQPGSTQPRPDQAGHQAGDQAGDQKRIDAALLQRYRAPAGLGGRLRGALTEALTDALTGNGVQPDATSLVVRAVSAAPGNSTAAPASGGLGSMLRLLRGPALCLASAAALLLILAPRLERAAGDRELQLVGGPFVGAGGDFPISGYVPISGDAECDDPSALNSPDLASLYHEVVSMAGSHETRDSECAHPGDGDSLLASLRQDFGTSLRQVSDVARLAGPFPNADWRSGTVLTGYPEEGGWPSVLVAESASNISCCVAPIQPSDPDLHVFTATVGSMALFEITRRGEPRFLDRFEQP